ncbi:hypothetical protein Sango_1880600 [Sesamum angolense]|uniref:Zinc knuckle CX2CX4HX4C domain-containing protein n=1 Tax=Sesamum angolense TaxID=2727404 RepID=A0AAE2BQQ4_9LAMI|nr:hypothetical protein Sango_1880600 [Sesamum angolense]
MAKHIGNRIGRFLDIELPENGLVWSSALKLKVSLDVSKPLKRALRLFSAQGNEKLVTLTYDRLPNFCYLCGCLGHIAKFCLKHYEDDFIDPGESLPCGPWLRENHQPKFNNVIPGNQRQAQTLRQKPHFSWSEYSSDSGRKDAQIKGPRIFRDFTGSKLGSDSPIEGKNSVANNVDPIHSISRYIHGIRDITFFLRLRGTEGDFNAILSDIEKERSSPTPHQPLRDFRLALGDSGLFNVAFSGHPFTWCNNREHPNTVWKRLDPACTNSIWNTTWPEIRVSQLRRIYSDHTPIVINREKERSVWSK